MNYERISVDGSTGVRYILYTQSDVAAMQLLKTSSRKFFNGREAAVNAKRSLQACLKSALTYGSRTVSTRTHIARVREYVFIIILLFILLFIFLLQNLT